MDRKAECGEVYGELKAILNYDNKKKSGVTKSGPGRLATREKRENF